MIFLIFFCQITFYFCLHSFVKIQPRNSCIPTAAKSTASASFLVHRSSVYIAFTVVIIYIYYLYFKIVYTFPSRFRCLHWIGLCRCPADIVSYRILMHAVLYLTEWPILGFIAISTIFLLFRKIVLQNRMLIFRIFLNLG